MKIAVCEDEKIFSDVLTKRISEYFAEKKITADVSVFSDGVPLLEKCREGVFFDIIFLDIQLENSDGMETAEMIRRSGSDAVLIFVTGLENRAVEGYAVSAFDYIVKSSLSDRLCPVLDRFMNERETGLISIPVSGGDTVLLHISDVLWLESEGRGTVIGTLENTYSSALPIGKISAMLPLKKIYRSA